MPRFYHRRWWRRCRTGFRWCRISLLLLVLIAVCVLVFLNQVGLPEPARRSIAAALRERKVDFAFENMRLDFFGGVVAERVFVEEAGRPGVARFSADAVGVQLNAGELLHGRFVVDSLDVRNGTVTIPLSTNLASTSLIIDKINTHVTLSGTNQFRLDELTGRCLGAKLEVSGWMENPEAMAQWRDFWFSPQTNAVAKPRRDWRVQLRDAVAWIEQFEFDTAPTLRITWRADGLDPMGLRASLIFIARGGHSEWGEAQSLMLQAHTLPATNQQGMLSGEVHLDVEGASTPWGEAESISLTSHAWPFDRDGRWQGAEFELSAVKPKTPWGSAGRLEMESRTLPQLEAGSVPRVVTSLHAVAPETKWARATELNVRLTSGEMFLTNPIPSDCIAEVQLQGATSEWGSAQRLTINASAQTLPDGEVAATNSNWGFWSALAPYAARCQIAGEDVTARGITAKQLLLKGAWRGPELRVESLEAQLAEGGLQLTAQTDVESRLLTAGVKVDFDVKQLDQVLGSNTMRWLSQFDWDNPPQASARAGLRLPEWINRAPDWRTEVVPTLWLQGVLTNEAGAFRGVKFDRARLDFGFTNQVWTLTNLIVRRPEGQLDIYHVSNEKTRDHYWRIVGDGHLKDFRPIFDNRGADRALEMFEFTGPVHLDGELWGRWRAPDLYGADVRVLATNFTFRGEAVDAFSAAMQFTNRNVQFQNVHLLRPEGDLRLVSGSFDAPSMRLWLTNGMSTCDPGVVLRPIGKETVRTMEPYQFANPPKVSVDGWINVTNVKEVDLRFAVEGAPFRWERFNLATVKANLHWLGQSLTLTDVEGGFYDGKLTGAAAFDFTFTNGSAFVFDATVWETDLHKLLNDVTSKTNRAEGVLNGRLIVTNALTWDLQSWQGYGHASLRDGLLWDTPVFGFLSKPLNALAPGLGNSRASAATNTFVITNSVIRTDDLTIFTGPARLQYRGTVDFDTRVNARVEAELLRDSPLLGQVLSTVLLPVSKIFEYRVTGTIAEPNPQPVWFLPKLLFLPFSPFKTMQDIFTPNAKPAENPTETPPSANP